MIFSGTNKLGNLKEWFEVNLHYFNSELYYLLKYMDRQPIKLKEIKAQNEIIAFVAGSYIF